MSRAFSLATCESFSRSLLYSEPAALAAWLRYRFARWLLSAPLKPSGWVYGDSASPMSHGFVHVGGADGGKINLSRKDEKIELVHAFPGHGFELGMPIPQTLMQQLPCPKASTNLWLHEGEDLTADATQTNLDPLGITRNCVLIDMTKLFDSHVAHRGAGPAGAALLLGVRPELSADLSKLARFTRRLAGVVDNPISRHVPYVAGMHSGWTPIHRGLDANVDNRAIVEETELVFCQHGFRSVIFFASVQGRAHGDAVGYFGRISNPTEDDKGTLQPHATAAEAATEMMDKVSS